MSCIPTLTKVILKEMISIKRQISEKGLKFKSGLFMMIGILLLIFGVYIIADNYINRNDCTVKVTGIIIGYDKSEASNRDMERGVGPSYTPIFEYEYNETLYRSQMSVYGGYKDDIGSKKEIFINPEKPKEIYYPYLGDFSIKVSIIILFLGMWVSFFGILSIIKLRTEY